MARPSRYSPEVRERLIRMVQDQAGEHGSQWTAIAAIAPKGRMHDRDARRWVRQAERDAGHLPGLTTDERQRLKELEREVRELKRANEILRKASAYFAQAELDRRVK
jgi:transposase